MRRANVGIAVGVRETGEREVLDVDVGASEEGAFWLAFLRNLASRGLEGVQLVISDAHEGLKEAIGMVLTGPAWQRCRDHFMRNVLAHVPRADKTIVAAAIRTVFAQPHQEAARQQLAEVVKAMEPRWPKGAKILLAGEDEVLTYMGFPSTHWTRIHSTNPLERLNREVKRRTNVVGIFPNADAVLRLVGSVLIENNDEWQARRRYFSLQSMKKLKEPVDLSLQLAPDPLYGIALFSRSQSPEGHKERKPDEPLSEVTHKEAPTNLHHLTRRKPNYRTFLHDCLFANVEAELPDGFSGPTSPEDEIQ